MPRYISGLRLRAAITALSEWRANTQAQGSMHLFPLLSLIARGVNKQARTRYEEADDFAFFDRYFRVFGADDQNPYFDPLTLQRRIKTHPHSNAATMRKNTFENRWGAAASRTVQGTTTDGKDEDQTEWILSKDFASTVVRRAMTRSGDVTRAPVVDVACWLFRQNEFPDDADAKALERIFRERFPLGDEDYNVLFEFADEPADGIFSPSSLTGEEIRGIAESMLVGAPRRVEAPVPPPKTSPKTELPDDDPILLEVRSLLVLGSSGIILRGSPGTSKTWYAWQIALALTENDTGRIDRVQFHPSYGYEDFVEGHRPSEKTRSGFRIVSKRFLKAVKHAVELDRPFVFIIDEINRGDPARIFGELLTYIETGWRDTPFPLPYSGKAVSVPKNLILLATMNPHDRSITQLDMALLRRFDHIDIDPSKEKAGEFLSDAGMVMAEVALVVEWFDKLQKMLPFGIGHTYFLNVRDLAALLKVWHYRILPFCKSVLEFEPERLDHVRRSFDALHQAILGRQTQAESGG